MDFGQRCRVSESIIHYDLGTKAENQEAGLSGAGTRLSFCVARDRALGRCSVIESGLGDDKVADYRLDLYRD